MLIVLLICLLIAATAFLALAETSLVASRPSRLAEWQHRGNKRAGTALHLARHPDALLTTIEICVTSIGIIVGALTEGASLTHLQAPLRKALHGNTHWLGMSVIIFITLIMLLAQIVPKRLAVRNPETIAMTISVQMDLLTRLLRPVVVLVVQICNAILKLFPTTEKTEPPVSDEEILMLVAQGTKAGVFEQAELDMFHSILGLEEIKLSSLMIPRIEMHWIDVNADRKALLDAIVEADIWELPVCDDNPDNVLGVIDIREVLAALYRNDSFSLRSLIRPALYVPDTEDALFMLESFKHSGHHISILMDEFGGVTGIVTIRSLMEEIVGNIRNGRNERIEAVADAVDVWMVDGLTSIDDFVEVFQITDFDLATVDYATVAGLVISELGHLPDAGEQLKWHGLDMKVIALDGHRISKLRISHAA